MQNIQAVVGIHPAHNTFTKESTQSVPEKDFPPIISRAVSRTAAWHDGLFSTLHSPALRQLLAEFVRCTNAKLPHGDIWVSNSTLASRMEVSVATVKRGIQALQSKGWIHREQSRSRQNKFSGSCTRLSQAAVHNLGLDLPAPSSLFFRGSDLSSTIGNPVVQSSTKRQTAKQDFDGDLLVSAKTPIREKPKTGLSKGHPEATNPENRTRTAEKTTHQNVSQGAEGEGLVRLEPCLVPKALSPLLTRLNRFEIYRLMGDARKQGHFLENITTVCQNQILASRRPIAYIRRLIQCDKDWAWLRERKDAEVIQKNLDDTNVQQAQSTLAQVNAFCDEFTGRHFMSKTTGKIYKFSADGCECWWPEESGNGIRRGRALVTADLMQAVRSERLESISSSDAEERISKMDARTRSGLGHANKITAAQKKHSNKSTFVRLGEAAVFGWS